MKFALLGLDAETEALARVLLEHPSHQIVWIGIEADTARHHGVLDERHASLPTPTPLSRDAGQLESSVLESRPEAIIVAYQENSTTLLDRVRRLRALQIPVVLSHPVNLSVLAHYELELIASEPVGHLVTQRPAFRHPAARALVGTDEGSDGKNAILQRLGTIEHITCERALHNATPSSVLRAFTADMDLVQAAAGDLTEVAAMGGAGKGTIALPVDVQMSTPTGVLARWFATSAADGLEKATLSITGSEGSATLEMLPDGPWTLTHCSRDGTSTSIDVPAESDDLFVDTLVRRIAAKAGGIDDSAEWRVVTRSLELAEGFEKSIRKGRTIHLRYDGRGETDAFKGTMASVGCGLLIAGLFLFVGAAVAMKFAKVEGFTRMSDLLNYFPHVFLGVLALFLLLQILRFIIPRDR